MEKRVNITWLGALLGLLPFLLGGFFEWTSCPVSLLLLYLLVRKLQFSKTLRLSFSLAGAAAAVIPTSYLQTVLWAQDRGMALPGFCKFFPITLFALLLLQEDDRIRDRALDVVPWSGATMTVLCLPLSHLPLMDGHLLVAGRQAGLFEYPNTYALFLLLGLIVLATGEHHRWVHLALAAVLLVGIFFSGSRTVFLLLILSSAAVALFHHDRVVRLTVLILLPSSIAVAIGYVLLTGDVSSIGRFITTSLHNSTFLGRLLYAQDALPLILRHPFGLGYRSYAYMQGSYQTGSYAVQTVHNDLLQLMLDVGWLPALLLTAAVVHSLLRKDGTLRHRLLLSVICLHGLLDFSLQYISILLLLFLLLDYDHVKTITLKRGTKRLIQASCGVLAAISLYFGMASALHYVGDNEKAIALDPYYTDALVALMLQQADAAEADIYAQRVLALDAYVAPAYQVRAVYAYSQGDFSTVITQQEKALRCAPYDLSGYTDYIDMLIVGMKLYQQVGDKNSAEVCRQRLLMVPELLQQAYERTSPLGWKITDKPQLILPKEYQDKLADAEQGFYN